MDKIQEKLKKIISDKFGVPLEQISTESSLSGDFNLSTIEINDLIGFVRREFSLDIPKDNEVDDIQTVEDLLTFIENYSENI